MRLSAVLCLLLAVVPIPAVRATTQSVREEPVRFVVGSDTLAGTLSLPSGRGPHPAIVLLSGGRPDNRDAQLGDFRPFKILADSFAAHGVAALRYDDRGVGESRGRGMWDYALDDHAAEAVAAVSLLRSRADMDSRRIGLLGHSYGTWMATRAAERGARPRFLVLLAPSVLKYRDLQAGFQRRNAILAGTSAADAEDAARFELEVFGPAVRGQRDWREIETLMRERERRDWDRLPSSAPSKQAGFEDYFRGSWYSFMLQMGPTPMMRFFWDFDARPTYQHVRAPVLAVFGGADTMCSPDESAPGLREALAHEGNRDVTVVVTPEADHFLQVTRLSKTDFAPGVVDRVVNWVAGRVGTARK